MDQRDSYWETNSIPSFYICVKCVLNTWYIHFLIWHGNAIDDDLQTTCSYLLIFMMGSMDNM